MVIHSLQILLDTLDYIGGVSFTQTLGLGSGFNSSFKGKCVEEKEDAVISYNPMNMMPV